LHALKHTYIDTYIHAYTSTLGKLKGGPGRTLAQKPIRLCNQADTIRPFDVHVMKVPG
jgi:hypothetical protein